MIIIRNNKQTPTFTVYQSNSKNNKNKFVFESKFI